MPKNLMELLNENRHENREAIYNAYIMGAQELIRLNTTAHPDLNLCFDVLKGFATANLNQRSYDLIDGVDL